MYIRLFKLLLSLFVVIAISLCIWNIFVTKGFLQLSPNSIFVPSTEMSLGKIYVINLDRSKERYANIKANLDTVGIPHTRFSAVDGYELKITDLTDGTIFFGKDAKSGKHKLQHGHRYSIACPSGEIIYYPHHTHKLMTAGEFGCYCSHIGIWREMVRDRVSQALIFEDDAMPLQSTPELFVNTLKNFPVDAGLFFFLVHNANKDFKHDSIIGNKYAMKLRSVDGLSCLAAYVIDFFTAQKFLAELSEFSLPLDLEIFSDLSGILKDTRIYTSPVQFIDLHPDGGSTINEMK